MNCPVPQRAAGRRCSRPRRQRGRAARRRRCPSCRRHACCTAQAQPDEVPCGSQRVGLAENRHCSRLGRVPSRIAKQRPRKGVIARSAQALQRIGRSKPMEAFRGVALILFVGRRVGRARDSFEERHKRIELPGSFCSLSTGRRAVAGRAGSAPHPASRRHRLLRGRRQTRSGSRAWTPLRTKRGSRESSSSTRRMVRMAWLRALSETTTSVQTASKMSRRWTASWRRSTRKTSRSK